MCVCVCVCVHKSSPPSSQPFPAQRSQCSCIPQERLAPPQSDPSPSRGTSRQWILHWRATTAVVGAAKRTLAGKAKCSLRIDKGWAPHMLSKQRHHSRYHSSSDVPDTEAPLQKASRKHKANCSFLVYMGLFFSISFLIYFLTLKSR